MKMACVAFFNLCMLSMLNFVIFLFCFCDYGSWCFIRWGIWVHENRNFVFKEKWGQRIQRLQFTYPRLQLDSRKLFSNKTFSLRTYTFTKPRLKVELKRRHQSISTSIFFCREKQRVFSMRARCLFLAVWKIDIDT